MDKSTVLVVDDEQNVRGILSEVLSMAGYNVIEARGGGAALDKAHHEHPDVIILDLVMPDLTGEKVLDALNDNPETRFIPVIMLTGKSREEDQTTAWSRGVWDYIVKPWQNDEVVLKVEGAIEASRLREETLFKQAWVVSDDQGPKDDQGLKEPGLPPSP